MRILRKKKSFANSIRAKNMPNIQTERKLWLENRVSRKRDTGDEHEHVRVKHS